MSRLSDPDEHYDARPKVVGPVLRRRRKRPLHPETIHDLLRAKVVSETPPAGWSWPHGWLLILWETSGRKLYRDLSPKLSYEQACEERDEEMSSGDYDKAWLIKKTRERET